MFGVILRPTRRISLLPYTTLFRSDRESADWIRASSAALREDPQDAVIRKTGIVIQPGDLQPADFQDPLLEGPDRKSTRLNSSHLVISYVVFGLTNKLFCA